MSIIYEVAANLDTLVAGVKRGDFPGLILLYATGDTAKYWPVAITDGTNYLWPEGKHLALTWGSNNGADILNRMGTPYRVLD